jgi:1-deoxy-D-xylulose-5-phosphate synthase
VAESLAEMGLVKPVLHLGLPDRFVEHGDPAVLLDRCGLNAAGIESAIGEFTRVIYSGIEAVYTASNPI